MPADDARRVNEERFGRTARQYAASRVAQRHAEIEALRRLAAAGPDDVFLDVACGPGVLLATFAPLVRLAVGLDLTPAMLQQARDRMASQSARGAGAAFLVRGQGERLPFADRRFSLVCSTSAVHHFGDPRLVLHEMARVCRSGGRVVIADLVGSEDDARRARQNAIERLRDPAHVEMLSASGLAGLLASCGLVPRDRAEGAIERELGEWFRVADTPSGVGRRVREMLLETRPGDLAGMAPRVEGDEVRFVHRWAIVAAVKA
jgi:ubiquinone/menaquinone biosynthesis C-methylase UbiE